jgi:hypothetical protein
MEQGMVDMGMPGMANMGGQIIGGRLPIPTRIRLEKAKNRIRRTSGHVYEESLPGSGHEAFTFPPLNKNLLLHLFYGFNAGMSMSKERNVLFFGLELKQCDFRLRHKAKWQTSCANTPIDIKG